MIREVKWFIRVVWNQLTDLKRSFKTIYSFLQFLSTIVKVFIVSVMSSFSSEQRRHVVFLPSTYFRTRDFNTGRLFQYWPIFVNIDLSPVHMRWYTHGVYIIHICIICTRVYFWACERNCIYVKVNLHMCKYTPPCKYTPAQTRCIFAFAYMYFIHVCIFGHVNAQQIYTRMQI